MRPLAAALSLLLCSATAFARVDLLLVPPDKPVPRDAGLRLTLYLNNPTSAPETIALPRVIEAISAGGGEHQSVQLEAVGDSKGVVRVPAGTRATVELRVKSALAGPGPFVSLRLVAPESNAIMFELQPEVRPATTPTTPAAARTAPADLDLSNDIETVSRHISGYEPIYLVAGWRGPFNARFQFSFKYRLFEQRFDAYARTAGLPRDLLRDVHFGYTQISLWDLDSPSKPFYDSSYKPAVFMLHRLPADRLNLEALTLQYGVQHESNGKSGDTGRDASRSLNTLFLAPTFRWDFGSERFLEARPRVIFYFNTNENRDITRYRGHVELSLRTGHNRGWQLAAHVRGHPRGHGSLEFNYTLPMSGLPWLREALGGYLQVQYFNGYGESLLDYNVRRRDQLRFGFTLVR